MKINFEFDTEFGLFRDCLNLPDNHRFSNQEIETMKKNRRDSWIDFIKNAPNVVITEDNNG
jgi:hypothetical protein